MAASRQNELAIINGQLSALRRRQLDYLAIVDQMQQLAASVATEIAELEGKALHLEREQFPIYRLPMEILMQVMSLSVVDKCSAIHLSQVCRSWRDIAVSAPELWGRIWCENRRWNKQWLEIYLKRSGMHPLDLVVTDDEGGESEARVTSEIIFPHRDRLHSVVVSCESQDSLARYTCLISDSPTYVPKIRTLDLSLTVIGRHIIVPPLTFNHGDAVALEPWPLERLRVQLVHPISLPFLHLGALTTLEMTFPLYRGLCRTALQLSALLHALSHTPRLQHLLLTDANLIVDWPHPSKPLTQVHLPQLRTLEWSYPQAHDVQHVLARLRIPAIETLEVWIDPLEKVAPAISYLQVASNDIPQLIFPNLRELIIQGPDNVNMDAVKRCSFPALAKLELTIFSRSSTTEDQIFPLPKFESVFRDPRLFHLTHITLSYFSVFEPTTMLGYLPNLVSLSIESCHHVKDMMQALRRCNPSACTATPKGCVRSDTGVKFCPKIESISLWRCNDLDWSSLLSLVVTRNQMAAEKADNRSQCPHHSAARNSRGFLVNSNGERVIRPLKKLRRVGVQESRPIQQTSTTLSPVPHTTLTYIRIEECEKISEEDALSLKTMGVLEVVFSGALNVGSLD